jgi:hypothetical protein
VRVRATLSATVAVALSPAITATGARGSGRIFITECDPDCAGGRRWSAKAVIRARRVRRGHFTRLSARYRHDGQTVTERWRLQVNSPTYAYWLAIGS